MLFPIKDYNPTRRLAVWTLLLILLNVGVFVYQAVFSNLNYQVARHSMIPWEITRFERIDQPIAAREGLDPLTNQVRRELVYRENPPLLTILFSMFMHGSLMHLVGNMLFLWIFGNNIEDRLGPWLYLPFYLACGVGASLLHVLFHPNSLTPVIGASGAVSGVMGAYLLLFPRAKVRSLLFIFVLVTFVDIPAGVFLVIWFVFQFSYIGGGGIAWAAHVGGFLLGMLLIHIWRRTQPRPRVEILQ
ncbi:MAG: rhomboid family intramembrane serine protease [Acidobacteriota bacterium]|jgi:membrane associated rhomboid family serine protease|nr:rhomboid family intramembrane serine protease [Acidobacteriota bacterium]